MSVLPGPSIQMARSLGSLNLETVPSMTPFELFKNQLESGSTEAAVDAMKRLGVVCAAMGPDEATKKLVPYLTQFCMSQPLPIDELLLLLGQQLMMVIQVVVINHHSQQASIPASASEAQDRQQQHTQRLLDFLPMLERLAAVEETVVRDQAVAVLVHLTTLLRDPTGKNAPDAATAVDVVPWMSLVKRLAAADWFTAKISAAGTVAPVLQLLNPQTQQPQQLELLSVFKELCQDETPMVRRAAAKNFGQVLAAAGWNHREAFGAQLLPLLCRDEQDSVRLLAAASLAQAGPAFGQNSPAWTIQHWLPLLKDASTDMSWRVRHNLAKNFSGVATTLGIQGDRRYQAEQSLVMACFVALLTDAEAEVRAASVTHLARMVAWGGQAHFATHLQPLLPALADDVVMEVRSKCALALMDTAHGGALEDGVILNAFGPLLESFLQDEFHEVQLQVLTNLHKVAHLLPGLAGVVTSLLQMSKATNWRVREAVAQLLPHLAEARGMDFFATVLLEPAWLTLLLDPVANVRMSIVSGMPLLIRVAGEEWISQTLLPHHVRIYNQHSYSYLVRTTLLRTHVEAAVECKQGALWNEFILQILRGLVDKVANVRMVAAKGLVRIVGQGDPAVVQAQIRPALDKRLQEDDDEDCRRACQLALDQIK